MIDLFLNMNLTCNFSDIRGISILQVAVKAIPGFMVYHSNYFTN